MGCYGSKASAPKAAAPASTTLLESPTQKSAAEADASAVAKTLDTFVIFVDSLRQCDCLVADESAAMLRVDDVKAFTEKVKQGADTEKVNKGDLVTKVRKVEPNEDQWQAGDASQMLSVLNSDGLFEVEIKRSSSQQPDQQAQAKGTSNPQDVVAEAPTEAQAEAPTEAQAEAPTEAQAEATVAPAAEAQGEAVIAPASGAQVEVLVVPVAGTDVEAPVAPVAEAQTEAPIVPPVEEIVKPTADADVAVKDAEPTDGPATVDVKTCGLCGF